jgi:hypothetical protein
VFFQVNSIFCFNEPNFSQFSTLVEMGSKQHFAA